MGLKQMAFGLQEFHWLVRKVQQVLPELLAHKARRVQQERWVHKVQ